MTPHPTETAAYWRRLARDERTFAKQARNVDLRACYLQNAAEYEAQAEKIETAERMKHCTHPDAEWCDWCRLLQKTHVPRTEEP